MFETHHLLASCIARLHVSDLNRWVTSLRDLPSQTSFSLKPFPSQSPISRGKYLDWGSGQRDGGNNCINDPRDKHGRYLHVHVW